MGGSGGGGYVGYSRAVRVDHDRLSSCRDVRARLRNLSPNLKGLEDEVDELEELSKLALSPVGVYSTQVSPNPCDGHDDPTTERAEEALALIAAAAVAASTTTSETEQQQMANTADEQSTPPVTASEPPTPAREPVKGNGRRTSHSWRGLKKQLSRVDLKLKNTFNATPAKKAATFYATQVVAGEQLPSSGAAAAADDDTAGGVSLPQIITETDDRQEQRPDTCGGGQPVPGDSSAAGSMATRPTELKLFDRDGKPIKPPRTSAKEHRKRTSLDKQGGNLTAGTAAVATVAGGSSRDARLLSVPNIKYSQRDPRHNRSNNQAFINLIKRLSKLNQQTVTDHDPGRALPARTG